MKPRNIETNYGKFPTLIHFERYWEDKVSKAFRDGFEQGVKYFKQGKNTGFSIIDPEKCECGAEIPVGFGYYYFGHKSKCVICGKVNQKEELI